MDPTPIAKGVASRITRVKYFFFTTGVLPREDGFEDNPKRDIVAYAYSAKSRCTDASMRVSQRDFAA